MDHQNKEEDLMTIRNFPKTAFIWIGAVLIYFAFLHWHNGSGTPLSETEVDFYVEKLLTNYPDTSPEAIKRWRTFWKNDDGKELFMVNAIDLLDKPRQIPGVAPTETSEQVLSKYTSVVVPYLLKSGAYPLFAGNAVCEALDIWGIKNAEQWTSGAVLRYRSRRDMAEMAINTKIQKAHLFKMASMEKTISYPVSPQLVVGGLKFIFALFLFSVASFSHLMICIFRLKRIGGISQQAR